MGGPVNVASASRELAPQWPLDRGPGPHAGGGQEAALADPRPAGWTHWDRVRGST